MQGLQAEQPACKIISPKKLAAVQWINLCSQRQVYVARDSNVTPPKRLHFGCDALQSRLVSLPILYWFQKPAMNSLSKKRSCSSLQFVARLFVPAPEPGFLSLNPGFMILCSLRGRSSRSRCCKTSARITPERRYGFITKCLHVVENSFPSRIESLLSLSAFHQQDCKVCHRFCIPEGRSRSGDLSPCAVWVIFRDIFCYSDLR